ncbi:MAG: four helix bundle protein [Geobacteraceae bacterium]|nr:four helix bundle protein [Geobacteraceae bacterium]
MKIEEMEVFKMAHDLTLRVYTATDNFPAGEKFGLVSQMRRASSSICMNLIEGAYRFGKNEYRRFVGIARGSCGELKYQLLLARDIGLIDCSLHDELSALAERICMMLAKLHGSLK